MKLINTEGMVFIGQGSEWLWTAVSGVVLAVTFLAIYRQLRLQAGAGAIERMQTLQGIWDSERMIRARLDVAIWRKHAGGSPPSFEVQAALGWLCGFFEDLADLQEQRYVSLAEVLSTWGQSVVAYWTVLQPVIQQERAKAGDAYPAFERLAQQVVQVARRRGLDYGLPETEIAAFLDGQIGRNTARLRILRDVSAGIIPTEPAAPPAPDPASSRAA